MKTLGACGQAEYVDLLDSGTDPLEIYAKFSDGPGQTHTYRRWNLGQFIQNVSTLCKVNF